MNDPLTPPQPPTIKQADYRILRGSTPDEVAEQATEYVRQGYQPAGPPVLNAMAVDTRDLWLIPVVLTEAEQLRIHMIKLQQEATIQQQGFMAEQINMQLRNEARANKLIKQAGQMGTMMEDGAMICLSKADFAILLKGLSHLGADAPFELAQKIQKLHDTCPEE